MNSLELNVDLENVLIFIRNGMNVKQPKGENRGLPITRIETISEGVINFEKVGFGNIYENEKYILEKGDILFSHINSESHLGKTAIFNDSDAKLIHGMNLLCLRPNISVVLPKFLLYQLRYLKINNSFISIAKRAVNQASLSITDLKKKQIKVLPLSEQQRIVEILDQAEELKQLRKHADAKSNEIILSLFYSMFGDPATNPKKFIETTNDEVILLTQYGTSKKSNNDDKGIPVIRMNNIDSNGLMNFEKMKFMNLLDREFEKYKLEKGDILFNRTNSKELVGKTGLWNEEFDAVPASYLIRVKLELDKVTPEYFWAFMNTDFIKNIISMKSRRAIGMANINATELKAFPFILPPINLQEKFSQLLNNITEIGFGNKSSLERVNQLFETLLLKAFDGSLTEKWREGKMKGLLKEMEVQKNYLGIN